MMSTGLKKCVQLLKMHAPQVYTWLSSVVMRFTGKHVTKTVQTAAIQPIVHWYVIKKAHWVKTPAAINVTPPISGPASGVQPMVQVMVVTVLKTPFQASSAGMAQPVLSRCLRPIKISVSGAIHLSPAWVSRM